MKEIIKLQEERIEFLEEKIKLLMELIGIVNPELLKLMDRITEDVKKEK